MAELDSFKIKDDHLIFGLLWYSWRYSGCEIACKQTKQRILYSNSIGMIIEFIRPKLTLSWKFLGKFQFHYKQKNSLLCDPVDLDFEIHLRFFFFVINIIFCVYVCKLNRQIDRTVDFLPSINQLRMWLRLPIELIKQIVVKCLKQIVAFGQSFVSGLAACMSSASWKRFLSKDRKEFYKMGCSFMSMIRSSNTPRANWH